MRRVLLSMTEEFLGELLQKVADGTVNKYPRKPAPEGFRWKPIVHTEVIGDTVDGDIEWVAKEI